jgi:adenylylsulfate kinase-like enzyme
MDPATVAGNAVLVLMCGLPGAGKSTLARSVAEALDTPGHCPPASGW